MTTQIKVLRENLIKQLSSIKDDNVSIADIVIERRKLLEALKLQTQPDADVININYGLVSWRDRYKKSNTWGDSDYWVDHEVKEQPCIQFSCNHTTMRFLSHPKTKHGGDIEPKVISLNFVDHTEYVKPKLSGIPIDTKELIGALNFVIHGVETDGQREVLECVLFDSGEDTLKLVTADGFRLSTAKFTAKDIPQNKILLNRLDIPKLLTFLKSNTEGRGKYKGWLDTYMKTTKKTVQFMSEKGMVEFDRQSGTYPDYSKLIPKDGTKIECIASDILEATKAVSVYARDRSGIIRLKFQKYDNTSKIILSARSEELGESSVDCDAIVQSDCRIAVNAHYLTDLLSQCGDARITLRVTTPSNPLVFDIGDTRQEIVMPMFVQWGDKEVAK